MVRAAFYDKIGLKKGEWSREEDEKLRAYIQRYGHSNWRQLPKFAGLARCGKSCRLRWLNYLRPNLKYGEYTQAEEEIIIKLHQKLGNKWSTIAAHLPGRTDSEIKNHWHTTLKKHFQQNAVTDEKVKASKAKDNEFNTGSGSVPNNGVLQVTLPATSQLSDSTSLLPPLPYSSELSSICLDHSNTTVARNENLVIEDDFTFLDAFTECVSGSLWTEPYLPDISYSSSEIVQGNCNSDFQSLDTIQILDVCALSPHHTEATMNDFWTQPDISPTFYANY